MSEGMLRDDPLIVLGMQHSGTSILADVLHRSGLFMHDNLSHHESKYFTRLNDRFILGGGDNWARIPLMPVAEVMSRLADVQAQIERKAYRRYVESGYDGRSRWGFKDPRACILLPLCLAIFPRAQLVHIVRNEDDVAASLASRAKKGVGTVADLDFWKELRRQYLHRAREYGTKHKHYYEVSYEDFCRMPVNVMRGVVQYLGVELAEATVEYLRATVYTRRIGAGRGGGLGSGRPRG